ncbi:MAG: 50S ribosomal protein L18e [Candidatus Marsarchaeota archaeon]|nr:50S ribosomal protein L18e [Candidatus Marsarchaeota archaeon]MCL5112054.1 50S ribosomal protein L18e [Candidatus Marsarchaeota archaeon]
MKTNAERSDVREWLDVLSKAAESDRSPKLWKRVHHLVSVPARRRANVNIYKINKHTKDGDNVVVPGKVLSIGRMDHKVNIAALEYSKSAETLLSGASCRMVSISEMIGQKRVNIII